MVPKLAGLLVIALAFACNNSSTPSGNTTAKQQPAAAVVPGGGCSNLVLFKKGAVIESKNYDAAGKEISTQTTTITDVKDSAGLTVADADINMQLPAGTSSARHLQYMCDGSGLFMDLGNLLSNLSSVKIVSASEKGMRFPINLSVGMELPESSLTLEMGRAGRTIKTTVSYKNRKVESKGNVTTAGGSWEAYKLNSDIVTETEMAGAGEHQQKIAEMMKKNSPVQRSVIWFSPVAGLIRMEMYSGETLMSRTDIVSIK